MLLRESILDKPKPDMDPTVWHKDGKRYVMTDEARQKIAATLKWLISRYDLPDVKVYVIGSIASNSYSSNSDIDLNVCSSAIASDEQAAQLASEVKKAYAELMEKCPDTCKVGTHPFEIYIQPNPYRCFSSAGCYDFFEEKWEVGPELKDEGYDPISEYYDNRPGAFKNVMKDIRNMILEVYETALVATKSDKKSFKDKQFKEIIKQLRKAAKLFKAVHDGRGKTDSGAKSVKTALKVRDNEKRHRSDAAYKFLDKFGYIAILREYSQLFKDISEKKPDLDEYASRIINVVQKNLAQGQMLADSEKELNQLEESFGTAIRNAVLAGAIAISGAAGAKTAQQGQQADQKPAVTWQAEISKSGLNAQNTTNLLATIAYNEASLDWLKTKNDDSLIAVLNTIQNRSGGKAGNFVKEISKPSQYYSVKNVQGGFTDKTYKKYDPSTQARSKGGQISPTQRKCWNLCVKYAGQTMDGTLKNVIGDRNMIANAKKDNKTSYDKWGKNCDLKIGSHTFGYDVRHDGYITYNVTKPASLNHGQSETDKLNAAAKGQEYAKKLVKPATPPAEYVVQKGDSIWKIAKDHNTTVQKIKLDNNLKTNTIKPGQKLMI